MGFFSAKPATMMWLLTRLCLSATMYGLCLSDLEGDGSNLQFFVHEERMRILFSSRCSLSGNGVSHKARDQEVASIAALSDLGVNSRTLASPWPIQPVPNLRQSFPVMHFRYAATTRDQVCFSSLCCFI